MWINVSTWVAKFDEYRIELHASSALDPTDARAIADELIRLADEIEAGK